MCRTKKVFAILFMLFLITGSIAVNRSIGAGPAWGHGGFGGDPVLELLQKLDLTDAQKKNVAGTLSPYVTSPSTLQSAVQAVAAAKGNLIANILQGNSSNISGDITTLENSETTLAELQSTIWLAIRTDLAGSAQLTTLDEIANEIGQRHDRFGGHHPFGLLHKLGLTKDQKSEIAGIFSANKANLKIYRANLTSARAQLIRDILLGNSSTSITNDLTALGNAQSALVGLQSTIWTDIRTDLAGSPQLTTLNNVAAKIGTGTFITAAIQKRFEALENWVAKHK